VKRSILLFLVALLAACKPVTNDSPSSSVPYWDALSAANAVAQTLREATGREYDVRPVLATGSMKPAIHDNSILVIELTKEFQVGDWVAFIWRDRGNIMVVHRVYSVDPFVVKGIANEMPDSGVPRDAVFGRVVAVVYAERRQ
jgi:hypothetical protein